MSDTVKRFPLQDGPSIPWSVIEPHERQALENHSQTLQRLAERGGLGCGEFWFVMNDSGLRSVPYKDAEQWGKALAQKIVSNESDYALKVAEVERLTSELRNWKDKHEHVRQQRMECNALITKIMDIVEKQFPGERESDFDVLNCGVRKIVIEKEKAEARIRHLETALEKINALQLDEICGWEELGRTARDTAWKALEALKHPPVESKGESQ